MDLDEAIRNRRSIRKFKGKRLPRSVVESIVEAGAYAPSACNMQMWHFVAVDEDAVKSKLCSQAGCPQIVGRAPATVFVFYDRNVNKERYSNIQSASAAVQNMLLKAHSLGVGSVWMSTYGDKEKVRQILGVPQNFMLIAIAPIGYPDEKPTMPKRREGVISFNAFGGAAAEYPTDFDPRKWAMEKVRDYREFKIRALSAASDEHRPEFKGAFKAIIERMPEIKGKVLDIFPYYANYSYALVSKGKLKDLTIYEMSDGVSKFLQNKFKPLKRKARIDFRTGTDFRLPWSSFNAILCMESLETVPDPEKVIAAAKRLLKDDGVLYILFINRFSITGCVHKIRMMRKLPVTIPFRPLAYKEIEGMLESNRLDVEDAVGISLVPNTLASAYATHSQIRRFCKFMLVKARKSKARKYKARKSKDKKS